MKPAEILLQEALSRMGFIVARHGYSMLVYDDRLEAFIHVHNLYRLVSVRLYRFGQRESQDKILRGIADTLTHYTIEVREVP